MHRETQNLFFHTKLLVLYEIQFPDFHGLSQPLYVVEGSIPRKSGNPEMEIRGISAVASLRSGRRMVDRPLKPTKMDAVAKIWDYFFKKNRFFFVGIACFPSFFEQKIVYADV